MLARLLPCSAEKELLRGLSGDLWESILFFCRILMILPKTYYVMFKKQLPQFLPMSYRETKTLPRKRCTSVYTRFVTDPRIERRWAASQRPPPPFRQAESHGEGLVGQDGRWGGSILVVIVISLLPAAVVPRIAARAEGRTRGSVVIILNRSGHAERLQMVAHLHHEELGGRICLLHKGMEDKVKIECDEIVRNKRATANHFTISLRPAWM